MILIDTNVVIDALDPAANDHDWALTQVVAAVHGEGGAINAVILAELCAGKRDPTGVAEELRSFGLEILDLPAATGPVCGKAYRSYKTARASSGGSVAPLVPLPDFFIGAHAQIMGWKVATRDTERFAKYFPSVALLAP
jgi:predicted nucleic acid-binding protein